MLQPKCIFYCVCKFFHSSSRLALPEVKYWLERFSEMDRDKDGFITHQDFCRYLAVPSDVCSQAVFSALKNQVDFSVGE